MNHIYQCKGNLSPHLQPQKVICCQNGDYCNSNAPVPIFNETFIERMYHVVLIWLN